MPGVAGSRRATDNPPSCGTSEVVPPARSGYFYAIFSTRVVRLAAIPVPVTCACPIGPHKLAFVGSIGETNPCRPASEKLAEHLILVRRGSGCDTPAMLAAVGIRL